MFYLLGILAGCCLPLQTSVNARLRGRTGSPYSAALISFVVGLVFLALLLVVTGEGVALPWGTLFDLPAWIWLGGVCGVIFLTLNILLFPRIGSVQTVILPTLGQILMGLIVDNFGLFRGVQVPLSVLRLAGAVLVIAGVVIVTLAKARHSEGASAARARGLIFWQIAGVVGGMLSATQTAVNGYLGKAIDSSLKASLVSFLVGTLLLVIVCLFTRGVKEAVIPGNRPWWMWIGGALGSLYVLANVVISGAIGTGMSVIILLVGATAGGLVVDHFGILGAQRAPVNVRKILGVVIMVVGAAMIKLL